MPIPPMTDDEADAFRAGVEWMRAQASAAALRVGDGGMAVIITNLPAPRIQRLGFGVTGEG